MKNMQRLLVIRDDKIGDFALTWFFFKLIMSHDSSIKIDVLVPDNLALLARTSPYINKVYTQDDLTNENLCSLISAENYDACICFSTSKIVCEAIGISKIHKRVTSYGNPHANNFSERLVIRKDLTQPAYYDFYAYLRALRLPYNRVTHSDLCPIWDNTDETDFWREQLQLGHKVSLIIHPGSGGSSRLYPLESYKVAIVDTFKVIDPGLVDIRISWSREEKTLTEDLNQHLTSMGLHSRLMPQLSLPDYAKSLVAFDIMLACSTGPLHLASLHNIFTIGLYAYKRSVRWRTLSEASHRYEVTVPKSFFRWQRRNLSRIKPELLTEQLSKAINSCSSKR
jgi:ADP-heptose:LPS heptosyltransferase